MIDYDFLNLSPSEFENISRDLLQSKLGIFIESFITGKDGGIDFRFTTDKAKTCIIQCKRYKDYNSLLGTLKKEVKKVVRLKPTRYILTTSAGLTPPNKADILKLFHPYILSTDDILGRDDINNLLGTYKHIEAKYYKLWLTSVNILQKILHSRIYNQSSFELEDIKEHVKLYVQNDSFNEALRILNHHRYIIISGIPGIGKTTLSRMLIFYLLSEAFDEFVYLTDTIDDGYEYFQDGKKQVFFFDDFLGKIRFDAKHLINADSKIVRFIEKIKKSPDKILIFATREYILSQARNEFEAFNVANIEIAKCILDLSSYTRIIKAQIIYNHLFFAKVPHAHLQSLVGSGEYMALINHKNYNPRIIETIINRKIWEYCTPIEFGKAFKSYFDNPESVWLYAFENSLNKFAQYSLFVLLTMGTPVLIEDLETALREFLVKNNYKYFTAFDSITFNRAIRELENTFITTKKDSFDGIVIEFQNPSIQDFLINYLRDKDDLITSLIESFVFVDQYFNIFTAAEIENVEQSRFIILSADKVQSSITRIKETFTQLKKARALRLHHAKTDKFNWFRDSRFYYSFLENIYRKLGNKSKEAADFVHSQFQHRIIMLDSDSTEQAAYIHLFKVLDPSRFVFDEENIVNKFLGNLDWFYNLDVFGKLEEMFPEAYQKVIASPGFKNKVEEIVSNEIANVEDSDIEDTFSDIESVELKYSMDFQKEIKELRRKEADYNAYIDAQSESYIDDHRESDEIKGTSEDEETEIINQIFNSLLDD